MFTGIGFKVQEEFKKVSRATLDIKVKQLNFTADGGRTAAAAINSWVANETNGKIDGIISSGRLHGRMGQTESHIYLLNHMNTQFLFQIP